MIDQQILEGNWNEIKGKLRQKWGQLTDDDLPQIRGDLEELIAVIQRKTGEAREAIQRYLQEVSGNAASAVGTAAEARRRERAADRQAGRRPGTGRLCRSGTLRSRAAGPVAVGVFRIGRDRRRSDCAGVPQPMTGSSIHATGTWRGYRP